IRMQPALSGGIADLQRAQAAQACRAYIQMVMAERVAKRRLCPQQRTTQAQHAFGMVCQLLVQQGWVSLWQAPQAAPDALGRALFQQQTARVILHPQKPGFPYWK